MHLSHGRSAFYYLCRLFRQVALLWCWHAGWHTPPKAVRVRAATRAFTQGHQTCSNVGCYAHSWIAFALAHRTPCMPSVLLLRCAVEPQEFVACLLSPSSQERQLGRTAHEDSHKATKGLLAPRKGMRTSSAGATEGQRAFHQSDSSMHLQLENPALGVGTCSFLYQSLSER